MVINSIFDFSIQDTKETEGKKNKMFRKKLVATLKVEARPKIQTSLILPHLNIFLVSQFIIRSGSHLFPSVSSWALWETSCLAQSQEKGRVTVGWLSTHLAFIGMSQRKVCET